MEEEDDYETDWEEEPQALRWASDAQGNAVVCNATGVLALADPPDACAPMAPVAPDTVLLAARGDCTFMTKARHASRAGAVALVVDNIGGEEGVVSMRGDDGAF